MEKRQSLLVALGGIAIVAAGAFWWNSQQEAAQLQQEQALQQAQALPQKLAPAPTAPVLPATPPAPVESDAVALSEEELDKLGAEAADLNTRAQELQAQVDDGKALIELKAKQIAELEAQLKASAGKN